MALFDYYLFADYSGDPDPKKQRCCISLWYAREDGVASPYSSPSGLDRTKLREAVLSELVTATEEKRRVLFGFDHQFSWPASLWKAAKFPELTTWRERLAGLVNGDEDRPKLTCDSAALEYAASFNMWKSKSAKAGPFYLQVSSSSKIGKDVPEDWKSKRKRFRLTELDCEDGFPAMELGKDRVAGQTLCGLPQLHQLITDAADQGLKLAFWPFDGCDITGDGYEDAHVGVEVYPSLFANDGWPIEGQHADDNNARDAWKTAKIISAWDQADALPSRMDLSSLTPDDKKRVTQEGWILGVSPHAD